MELAHMRIDEQMFETAVRRKFSSETVKLAKIENNYLSEKGLNFLSDLYLISLTYTDNSKNEGTQSERRANVIMKIEPSAELPRDMVRQQNFFITELKFLRDVLPRIKEVVGCQVGPDLYYCCENPGVLIMENLGDYGYGIKDRQVGFPLEHCALAMRRIAQMHAGSVLICEQSPGMIEYFTDTGIVSRYCPRPYLRMMEVSVTRIGNQIREWPDQRCSSAADKLINLSSVIGSRCTEAYNYEPDEFCVINHGDCWINNIMFKEDENGQPVDILLVDYQMSVYTSPAIDLLYFLNICPEYDVKYDKDDYLLAIYLESLAETMKRIGCKRKPPTMEELKAAIHKRRIYAVFSGIVLYFRMMSKKEDTEDFTQVFKKLDGETKMDVFRNPDAVRLAHKMIPIMNERGYFD